MIVLDTHIWIWWLDKNKKLATSNRNLIDNAPQEPLGISVISCWEIAKLVEKNRLDFRCSVEEWLNNALDHPRIRLLDLTLPIIIKSTQLQGFHQDPADQIIVATAQIYDSFLVTQDKKILNYPNVKTASLDT